MKNGFQSVQFQHIFGHAYNYLNAIAGRLAKLAVYGDTLLKIKLSIEEDQDFENKNTRDLIKKYLRTAQCLETIEKEQNFAEKITENVRLQEGDLVLISTHIQKW